MIQKIIIADRDAHVEKANPDTNYGSDSQLALEYHSGEPEKYTQPYLHFPMTSIPTGSNILAALFRIYVAEAQPFSQNLIYSIYYDDWEENTLTWNNRPGNGPALLNKISCASMGWVSVNIKDFVVGWVTGKMPYFPEYILPNYGIYIEPEYPEWPGPALFYSRGRAHFEPYIIVNYEYTDYIGNSYIID